MKVFSDYPFEELGDTFGQPAPVRQYLVLSYDGDKYCKVVQDNVSAHQQSYNPELEVKAGYLFKDSKLKKRVNQKDLFLFLKKVPVEEFFDPHNPNHMDAYIHLQECGYWPHGFIPDNVDMTINWIVLLLNKMADCWVEHYRNTKT